eukprot:gene3265-3543_t
MAFQDYFSVIAFFIFLRETLEASVIIAVLLQCMNRTCPRLKKQVWWGAAAGIILSCVAGGIFAAVFYLAQTRLFQGNGKLIFQGVISYLACILITYLGFAMMRFGNIEQKYMRKLDGAAHSAVDKATQDISFHKSHAWSVFLLAASAVLREGIESVIFLAGVGSQSSFKAIPLACLAGLVVGLAVGFLIYYSGRAIKDLKVFFIISTIVLFFIAAGQVSLGTQFLSKVGMFGKYAAWQDELAWHYRPVADLNYCCSDEFADGKQFFVLAHAVLGYQSRPTPIILFLYCFYWACVIAAVIYKYRNGSLFDADYKRKCMLLRLTKKVNSLTRQLTKVDRRISNLEGRLALDAGNAALVSQLAEAASRKQQLQQRLQQAQQEKDAEAERLAEEDRQVFAAAGEADQDLPSTGRTSDELDSSSTEGSPGARAIVADQVYGKDVELGVYGSSSKEAHQDPAAGTKGGSWLSKLSRKR